MSDDPNKRYMELRNFDEDMCYWETVFCTMNRGHEYVTLMDEGDKMIVFERGELVFIFNFHHSNSYENFKIGTNWPSDHMLLYDSDDAKFGGHNRLSGGKDVWYAVKN